MFKDTLFNDSGNLFELSLFFPPLKDRFFPGSHALPKGHDLCDGLPGDVDEPHIRADEESV